MFFAIRKGERHILRGGRPHDVIRIQRVNPECLVHPAEKPEKLIAQLILSSSDENDIVLDPFLGSGTTAVVCKKLGRHFIGIEKNHEYCNIARKRLQDSNLVKHSLADIYKG